MTPKNYNLIGTQMPWWLTISCRNRWYLKVFVEGGAGYGHTAAIACDHFQKVYAVEIVKEVFEHQVAELKQTSNATRLFGSTLDYFQTIVAETCGLPTLWYLDSHYPGLGPKVAKECPLLEEIEIISTKPGADEDVVLIDNAGMFYYPPNPPHDPAEWPTYSEVVSELKKTWPCVSLFADIIIATPDPILEIL
jgi:hypothetical protein